MAHPRIHLSLCPAIIAVRSSLKCKMKLKSKVLILSNLFTSTRVGRMTMTHTFAKNKMQNLPKIGLNTIVNDLPKYFDFNFCMHLNTIYFIKYLGTDHFFFFF